MGAKESSESNEKVAYPLRTLFIKKVIENSRNKEIAKTLCQEIPYISNYIGEPSLFGDINIILFDTKFGRSIWTIEKHMRIKNLDDRCKIGLTQKQMDMFLQLFSESDPDIEEIRKIILEKRVGDLKKAFENTVKDESRIVKAMTAQQCRDEMKGIRIDEIEKRVYE